MREQLFTAGRDRDREEGQRRETETYPEKRGERSLSPFSLLFRGGYPCRGEIPPLRLEDGRGDSKRLVKFVVEPTGQKKSGGQHDHIRHCIDSFPHCPCPSSLR